MAGFYGGDTEQMRTHAQACATGSQRIHDVTTAISAVVDSVVWTGPDAIAFRALWHGTVKPRIIDRANEIRSKGDEVEQHAQEQDHVSGPTDLSDLLDRIGGPLRNRPPLLPTAPHLGPLTPELVERIFRGIEQSEEGWEESVAPKDRYFYGDEGYGPGNAASDGRAVGDEDAGGSYWDGREVDGDAGYLDRYVSSRASSGSHTTEDGYGNRTTSGGGRAGAELGFDAGFTGPDGNPAATVSGRLGAEAYSEGGATEGPDGVSAGVAAGVGAYGDLSSTVLGPGGEQITVGLSAYAGAEAHMNAYGYKVRNDEGQVNGIAFGADGGAFMGARAEADFHQVAPGGWFSHSGSAGAEAGVGIGGGGSAVISTDEIGFHLDLGFAVGPGASASYGISIHPNEIVNDILPGDYDLDDMIGDAKGAFDAAGDFFGSLNPFD